MNISIDQSTYDNHPLQVRYESGIAGESVWLKVGDARVLMSLDEAKDLSRRLTTVIDTATEAREVAKCAA